MKKYEELNILNNFIEERIGENKELFTEAELTKIKNDFPLAKKLYLLGFINAQN